MRRTQISCTLDISGTVEEERKELAGKIWAGLGTKTGLDHVTRRPVSGADATTMLSFLATCAGRPHTGHLALIDSVVEHALRPYEIEKRPVNVAIADVHLELLPD